MPTVGGNADASAVKFSELTARMLNTVAAEGYSIWIDTADATNIYILEAPSTAVTTDTGFRGIRIPQTGSGKVQVNTGGTLTFSNRASDGGWS